MAIFTARNVNARFKGLQTAQPMTRRECRPGMTARFSPSLRVQMCRCHPSVCGAATAVRSFLIGPIRHDVTVERVRRHIERVIAIGSLVGKMIHPTICKPCSTLNLRVLSTTAPVWRKPPATLAIIRKSVRRHEV